MPINHVSFNIPGTPPHQPAGPLIAPPPLVNPENYMHTTVRHDVDLQVPRLGANSALSMRQPNGLRRISFREPVIFDQELRARMGDMLWRFSPHAPAA